MKDFIIVINKLFATAVADYHRWDDINTPCPSAYPEGSMEQNLYQKCWIDTVQWHLEDQIRRPDIDPYVGMELKRRIDRCNQERTDRVEAIDNYFWQRFHTIPPTADARTNTESPGWAIDRLSILHLKLWHIDEQAARKDVSPEQHRICIEKQTILRHQLHDLTTAIQELLDDYAQGRCIIHVYRQMKLYNDPNTNPVLYATHPDHTTGSSR